jgi:hypothetical protein
VCVCVRERERNGESFVGQRERACVRLRMCERERERNGEFVRQRDRERICKVEKKRQTEREEERERSFSGKMFRKVNICG